ncbi:MAG TPA: MBL fold metallo-hydrolase [Actinomycetota bacterium]|jgi:glyoxylase-like metal-dependent hydrolase (beta-lactamase superfamily II)|nr:MBL fold metallo-hydrolase [Actinomycetota bacterium]
MSGERPEAVARWSERVTRVLAPNPSLLTLEGTNTYVVASPEARGAVVIDPGPPDEEHAARVAGATSGRQVELVLLTHSHVDHAEGARRLAQRVGAPLAALDPGWATPGAPTLAAGSEVVAGGVLLEPVPTPGHSADHCCFWLAAERAMFTGDHVLGRGSTVVEWPGGDMGAYLHSLEAVRRFAPERLYPGHGPGVGDPAAKLREYLDHRLQRESQVLAALGAGDRTPAEIVGRVYADVDPVLHPAAALSVRAHLVKLVREGRALERDGAFAPVG